MHIILIGVFVMVTAFGVGKKTPALNLTDSERARLQLDMALDNRRYSKMIRFQDQCNVRGSATKGIKISPIVTRYSTTRIGITQ